jgi:DNA-directed RNA polymerase subunit RPC12/RpoP
VANLLPTATSRPRKSGFCIRVTCPGCGAELELQGDFFVLVCSHCESVLRIVMPDTPPAFLVSRKASQREALFKLDRYCREQGLPFVSGAHITQISIPYWKFDAVALKVRHTTYEVERGNSEEGYEDTQTEEREFKSINLTPVTITRLALPELSGVPVCLGLRTDYLRMIPFSQENTEADTTYYSVSVLQETAQTAAFKGVLEAGRIDYSSAGKNRTEVFSPVAGIVYFPYFRVESISPQGIRTIYIDGVTGKVAGNAEQTVDSPIAVSPAGSVVQFGVLTVMLHRCGNCGLDLPLTQSYAYQCHNCGRLAFLERHPLLQEPLMSVSASTGGDRLFPFWSMQFAEQDRSALRKIFGGISESDRIMVPAFRIRNTEAMYRLCKRMSAAAGRVTFAKLESISSGCTPASVSLREALTMVDVLWRRDLAGREMRTNIASGFSPISAQLTFVPFSREQYFYVDTVLKAVTVEVGAVG